MTRRSCFTGLPCLGLALCLAMGFAAPQAARAEYFAYNTSLSVDPSTSSGITSVTGNGSDLVRLTTDSGGALSIRGSSDGSTKHLSGIDEGTDIVFGYINADDFPETQQMVAIDFAFRLDLTDYNIPAGGSPTGTTIGSDQFITISGMLVGTIGGGEKINLRQIDNYDTDPMDGLIMVGETLYEVTLGSFTAPGRNPGAFGAHVRVFPQQAVPEPASFVLCGLGALGLGGLALRRRFAQIG